MPHPLDDDELSRVLRRNGIGVGLDMSPTPAFRANTLSESRFFGFEDMSQGSDLLAATQPFRSEDSEDAAGVDDSMVDLFDQGRESTSDIPFDTPRKTVELGTQTPRSILRRNPAEQMTPVVVRNVTFTSSTADAAPGPPSPILRPESETEGDADVSRKGIMPPPGLGPSLLDVQTTPENENRRAGAEFSATPATGESIKTVYYSPVSSPSPSSSLAAGSQVLRTRVSNPQLAQTVSSQPASPSTDEEGPLSGSIVKRALPGGREIDKYIDTVESQLVFWRSETQMARQIAAEAREREQHVLRQLFIDNDKEVAVIDQVRALNRKVAERDEEIERLRAKLRAQDSQLALAAQNGSSSEAQGDRQDDGEHLSAIEHLTRQLEAAQADHDDLQQRNDQLAATLAEVREEHDGALRELVAGGQRAVELEAALSRLRTDHQRLQESNAAMEQQVQRGGQLASELADARAAARQAEHDSAALRQQVAQAEVSILREQDALKASATEVAALKAELARNQPRPADAAPVAACTGCDELVEVQAKLKKVFAVSADQEVTINRLRKMKEGVKEEYEIQKMAMKALRQELRLAKQGIIVSSRRASTMEPETPAEEGQSERQRPSSRRGHRRRESQIDIYADQTDSFADYDETPLRFAFMDRQPAKMRHRRETLEPLAN